MATPAIDLSAGLIPARPPASSAPDLSAGLVPRQGFFQRVGNRVQQNADAMTNLPAEASREISSAASNPHSFHALVNNVANATYGALTRLWSDYSRDPANAVGDVATAYIGGAATEGADLAPEAAASTKAAPAEMPLVGKLVRAYDFVKNLGGGAHPPELAPVLDGLNELGQGVLNRIQKARAAGLSDVAPSASRLMGLPPQAAPSSRLMGIPQVRGFSDVQEDAGIEQGLQADLDQQGEAVRAEQAREFAARNSMDVPKWQRIVNQKVQTLLDQAEQKSTSSTQVKPYKAKAAAAAGGDDLTSILKASLDVVRKKRGLK